MFNHFSAAPLQNHDDSTAKSSKRGAARMTLFLRFACLSLLAGLMLAVWVLAQTQETQQDSSSKKISGFLGDYSALSPDPKNGDLLIYKKSANALKGYHKFIIEPVTVYLLPEAQDRGIDPDDLDRLARYFTDAIEDQLLASGSYDVVTEPGPGVAVLRVAITNVEPTGRGSNAAVKGGAAAASIAVAPGASLAVPRLSIGKIGIEGEMVDSVSGDRIAAVVTSKSGRRWFSGLNAYKKWGDIESAFRSWAKDFRKRLDQANQT